MPSRNLIVLHVGFKGIPMTAFEQHILSAMNIRTLSENLTRFRAEGLKTTIFVGNPVGKFYTSGIAAKAHMA
jgi:hypothetical protein